jgi:GNAT superfamily N-acetyltransferase
MPVPARAEDWTENRSPPPVPRTARRWCSRTPGQLPRPPGARKHCWSGWPRGEPPGAGLLRSVPVPRNARNRGFGTLLTGAALECARGLGVRDVYLLTTSSTFFERHGFRPVARSLLLASLGASHEFRGAYPANAVALRRSSELRSESR